MCFCAYIYIYIYIYITSYFFCVCVWYSEMHDTETRADSVAVESNGFGPVIFQDTCATMLKRRPGCIIAAKTGSKPLDLIVSESARVPVILHLKVQTFQWWVSESFKYDEG